MCNWIRYTSSSCGSSVSHKLVHCRSMLVLLRSLFYAKKKGHVIVLGSWWFLTGHLDDLPATFVCICWFRGFVRPPLWSSGQRCWLQIQRSRVRSPALLDFLSSSGSGTGSTQPREVKLRSYLNKKLAAPGSENRDYRPWGSVALTTWHPSIRKSWH